MALLNGELAVFERSFNRCMGLCPSAEGDGFLDELYDVNGLRNSSLIGFVSDEIRRLITIEE